MLGRCTVLALVAAALGQRAQAQSCVIDDASLFDTVPYTLVDFETRSDGSDPFAGICCSEGVSMPHDEYAGSGFQFAAGADVDWLKINRDGVQEVLQSGGSPVLFVAGGQSTWDIEFLVPVRAFGLFALSDRLAFFPAPPPSGLRIYDTQNNVLDEIFLDGNLLDGQIELVEYGFMGYQADVDIGRVEVIQPVAFGIDDLYFTSSLPMCPAELTGDTVVDGDDLATLLSQWGTIGRADLNASGGVGGADLAIMLANWGVCGCAASGG